MIVSFGPLCNNHYDSSIDIAGKVEVELAVGPQHERVGIAVL